MPLKTPTTWTESTPANSRDNLLDHAAQPPPKARKPRAFWSSFVAIMMTTFLSAMDLTAIGIALPTIANALNDAKGDYSWIGSAYALSSTAVIPLSGSLADIFGRKPIMLICIGFFVLGSILAGAAQNMPMMISARGVQGIGGGGIIALSEILVSDLVPLAERGTYKGLIGLAWALACSIGPPLGGALAAKGNNTWRWIFFLNIPLAGIAFVLVAVFLQVRRPEGSIRRKLAEVDWLGNAIVAMGSGLTIIGLAWGGVRYSWGSGQVLAPLIIGLLLLVVFAVYEANIPIRPTIPSDLLTTRTGISAIIAVAIHGIASIAVIYYLPVFFLACFGTSPLRAAVDVLPLALAIAPFAVIGGVTITISQKYRLVNWIGWAITIVGFGLLSTMKTTTTTGMWVGFQFILAMGLGPLFTVPSFPLLAPLPPDRAAAALALFSFTRTFFQTWGITICSTILQNSLQKNLPGEFVSQFPPGFEIAYAAIPYINKLEEPLRAEVRSAFASSMAVIWRTMIGVAGLGLLISLIMAEIPMTKVVDENFGLVEDKLGDSLYNTKPQINLGSMDHTVVIRLHTLNDGL
ncbi:iron permease [Mycena rebaudengoi]|nr:iron permease [Mycena rebaudengoi]